MIAFEMLFNFYIQTKHFITKKSKFFKKMNCFIQILYPNTLLRFVENKEVIVCFVVFGIDLKYGFVVNFSIIQISSKCQWRVIGGDQTMVIQPLIFAFRIYSIHLLILKL